MSFMHKFKGKTTQITKQGVTDLLGNPPNHPHTPSIKNINHSFTIDLPNKRSKRVKNNSQNVENEQQKKKVQKINPFSVSNPFFLDEEERERTQRVRREKQIKERIQRQRRKRKEIEQRMAEFNKINKQKFNNKQWLKLGGLGPNLGGPEWSRKKQMQQKMMKFAQEIKQINFQRLKRVPYMSYSGLRKQGQKDARTKALEYSRTVPRPHLIKGGGEVPPLLIPKSQSRQQLSELQMLQENHLKYMSLIRRI